MKIFIHISFNFYSINVFFLFPFLYFYSFIFAAISFLGIGNFPVSTTYPLFTILYFLYFYSILAFFYSSWSFFFFAYSSCFIIKFCPYFYNSALLLLPVNYPFTLKNIGPNYASQWGSTIVAQFMYYFEVITN